MNEQEQRIKIAEACGWARLSDGRDGWKSPLGNVCSNDGFMRLVPDCLNDRNAMINALSVLSSSQRIDMLCNLERQGITDDWALLTAEPKAIAQAFLETLNLWAE